MDLKMISDYVEGSAFLYVAGILTVCYVACKFVFNLYTSFIIYFTSSTVDMRKFGRWALVTGSTDGIGKGIAKELAKLGINLLLVSRNSEKLRKVAREIETEFQVEVQYVAFDFTNFDEHKQGDDTSSVYDVIRDKIRDLEIGILVNNVGMFIGKPVTFLDSFESKKDSSKLSKGINDLVHCNDTSMVKMTQLVLPGMVERKKGLIINVASMAASFSSPFLTLYAASKKFNDTFSNALSYEYEHQGITIQSIQPGFVKTNMVDNISEVNASVIIPSYSTFASSTMKTIGKARMAHGYWSHALQIWLLKWIPECLTYYNIKFSLSLAKYQGRRKSSENDNKKKFQ